MAKTRSSRRTDGPAPANALLRRENALLRRENARLREEILRDPLTGLYNRAGLRHVWDNSQAKITGVVVIDADHFKTINDRYGHHVGDIVICSIANAISRADDTIGARPGGDEFIVLTAGPDPVQTARRLRDAIAVPTTVGGSVITITATMGLVVRPDQGTPLFDLLKIADNALYQGKRTGRDTIVIV